jgi:hypothetical protein
MAVFKDFVPQMVAEAHGWFGTAEYEHFDAAAEAAVAWIVSNEIQLLSIETVILPGTPEVNKDNEGYIPSMITYAACYQFVRVWYRDR